MVLQSKTHDAVIVRLRARRAAKLALVRAMPRRRLRGHMVTQALSLIHI
jgi:hypothetical protein